MRTHTHTHICTQACKWSQTNTVRHHTYSPWKPVDTQPESPSWQSHINHSVLALAHTNSSAKSLHAGPVTPPPTPKTTTKTQGSCSEQWCCSSVWGLNEKQINSARFRNSLPTQKQPVLLLRLIYMGDIWKGEQRRWKLGNKSQCLSFVFFNQILKNVLIIFRRHQSDLSCLKMSVRTNPSLT